VSATDALVRAAQAVVSKAHGRRKDADALLPNGVLDDLAHALAAHAQAPQPPSDAEIEEAIMAYGTALSTPGCTTASVAPARSALHTLMRRAAPAQPEPRASAGLREAAQAACDWYWRGERVFRKTHPELVAQQGDEPLQFAIYKNLQDALAAEQARPAVDCETTTEKLDKLRWKPAPAIGANERALAIAELEALYGPVIAESSSAVKRILDERIAALRAGGAAKGETK